jgi:hypothetical protein
MFIVAVVCCSLAGLVAADAGFSQDLRLQTRLEPCCVAAASRVEGQAERRLRDRNGDTIPERDRFKVTVEIPLPTPELGLTTPEQASSADVRVILSRGHSPYAECFLRLDGVVDDSGNQSLHSSGDDDSGHDIGDDNGTDSTARAQYKLDLELLQAKGVKRLRQKKGTCDIDLTTEGRQSGMPNIQPGDVALATIVTNPADPATDIDFLEGTFDAGS